MALVLHLSATARADPQGLVEEGEEEEEGEDAMAARVFGAVIAEVCGSEGGQWGVYVVSCILLIVW